MNLTVHDLNIDATSTLAKALEFVPERGAKPADGAVAPHALIDAIKACIPPGNRIDLMVLTNFTKALPLHADNCKVVCDFHGTNSIDCRCPDAKVEPNHSHWRTWTAILYLGECTGGELIVGENPGLPDRGARTVYPAPGRLVVFPADRWHFHRTMEVTAGTRPALTVWFTKE